MNFGLTESKGLAKRYSRYIMLSLHISNWSNGKRSEISCQTQPQAPLQGIVAWRGVPLLLCRFRDLDRNQGSSHVVAMLCLIGSRKLYILAYCFLPTNPNCVTNYGKLIYSTTPVCLDSRTIVSIHARGEVGSLTFCSS